MLNSRIAGQAALAAALLVLSLAPGAGAAPVTVKLRVEGLTQTIYEQRVTTDAKNVTGGGSQSHKCDGTNGSVNPAPGPTMTSALDDGAIAGAFTWAGTWFDSFDDFGIDRIGPDAVDNDNFRYWGYALNGTAVEVGGCQQQVKEGDEVLFAYDFFNKVKRLTLSGPATANAGDPVGLSVADTAAESRPPVQGATVGGAMTGADGVARVTFTSTGTYALKAEAPDAVRSNAIVVCVHDGADGNCGTVKPVPPSARVAGLVTGAKIPQADAPTELRFEITPGTSPVSLVKVSLTTRRAGVCRAFSARTGRFRVATCRAQHFTRVRGDVKSGSVVQSLSGGLARGRYVLDVAVKAHDGRTDSRVERGRTRIVFRVS